jgi:glycine dehydrogenase subunit 1
MLDAIGVADFEELLAGVPAALRSADLTQPSAQAEPDLLRRYRELSRSSELNASFVGAGLYGHFVPTAVDMLLQRGELFTAYTPYQPEASQGTLQAVFEFQTIVAELMGLDVANASMYDFASAAAEAVLMSFRLSPKRRRVLLSDALHPDTVEVIRTYLSGIEAEIEVVTLSDGNTRPERVAKAAGDDVACVVVQNPNCFGLIERVADIAAVAHECGAKLVVAVNEPTSLGLLAPPGACGADIAVGEGTGIGVGPSFGGPGLGLFATKQQYVRQMPGRLAGEARDADGRLGYVLTLSTREQHIRRERATSNICTNHGLCALAFAIHASLLGPHGLRAVALQCAQRARYLARGLAEHDIPLRHGGSFYNEISVELGDGVERAIELGLEQRVAVGFDLGRWREDWRGGLLIATSELHGRKQLDALIEILAEAKS